MAWKKAKRARGVRRFNPKGDVVEFPDDVSMVVRSEDKRPVKMSGPFKLIIGLGSPTILEDLKRQIAFESPHSIEFRVKNQKEFIEAKKLKSDLRAYGFTNELTITYS